MLERPITFKVRLLSGREGLRQPQLSLLRRTFQPAAGTTTARITGESRLGKTALNRNQGAESTLAYLQALLALDAAGLQATLHE